MQALYRENLIVMITSAKLLHLCLPSLEDPFLPSGIIGAWERMHQIDAGKMAPNFALDSLGLPGMLHAACGRFPCVWVDGAPAVQSLHRPS